MIKDMSDAEGQQAKKEYGSIAAKLRWKYQPRKARTAAGENMAAGRAKMTPEARSANARSAWDARSSESKAKHLAMLDTARAAARAKRLAVKAAEGAV